MTQKITTNEVPQEIGDIIKQPELYDWAGADWFEAKALANQINQSIANCDGTGDNPTPQQAVDFYSRVIDLGGGKFFAWEYCTQPDGPGAILKRNPEVAMEALPVVLKFHDASGSIARDESGNIIRYCAWDTIPDIVNDNLNYNLDEFICCPQSYKMDEQDFMQRMSVFASNIHGTVEVILNFYNYWFDQGYGYLLVDSFVTQGIGKELKKYAGAQSIHDDIQHMYLKLYTQPPHVAEHTN